MSKKVAVQKPVNFKGLQSSFERAIEKALSANDVQILIKEYNSFSANSEHDKRSPMDQAFRETLLLRLIDDVDRIGILVRLSVSAARAEIVSNTIPVVLLGDTFDAITLNTCEQIFKFVEELVDVWKEEIFFTSCKNNILRMCNDLLRRLSRTQNTIFCGRILLFLSRFFPFSERSGLNIVSEFNLENGTEFGNDGKDVQDALEEAAQDIPIKVDYNLYCKFWSLQDFFRNPNQCYCKAQWKMFQIHATTILEAFSSFKLEDSRMSTTFDYKTDVPNCNMDIDIDIDNDKNITADQLFKQNICKGNSFFAKFLTNPKLIVLQLSDSNFRRSVLVQILILFQYLQLSVKFKIETYTLTPAQIEFIKETTVKVYNLFEDTPPDGTRFAQTVKHMLLREEMWNSWKNEGCKEFKKPSELEESNVSAEDKQESPNSKKDNSQTADNDDSDSDEYVLALKRPRMKLGDSLREATHSGKFYLGNKNLTKLWNHSPDNLLACKSEERNFLPLVENFLENTTNNREASYEWRALRLLARQTPHFFTFVIQPSCKTSEYLDAVRKRLLRDKDQTRYSNSASSNSNGNTNESNINNNVSAEQIESESVALQDNEEDTVAGELVEEDVTGEVEKADDDCNAHANTQTVTKEHINEISPLIADNWMKLGKKIGFTPDELLFFDTDNPGRNGGCIAMLSNWANDDVDATLDNFAYMLEGLGLDEAAEGVKAIIERSKIPEKATIEVLSD